MKQIQLLIPDIHCSSCVGMIKLSLSDQPGVDQVEVDLSRKTAWVSYDPELVDLDQIIQLITDSGYKPQPLV